MADVPEYIMEAARECCAGFFTGHRELYVEDVARAMVALSERERRTAQGVTPEIVEALCSSPIIEELTPTVYEMSACQTVQDEYNLMKRRIRKAFAAPSLSTSAGKGEP